MSPPEDVLPADRGQKRQHGRILGQRIDAGSYGENPTPSSNLLLTEDGTLLRLADVLSARDVPAAPKAGKGPSPATAALVGAAFHYERHGDGIDEGRPVHVLLRAIGRHAVKHSLDGCELIDDSNGSQKLLMGVIVAALKNLTKS